MQANLVNTLHDYRVNLELLHQARHPEAVAVTAAQATEAARAAETVANRFARALDAIDDAVTLADRVARQMVRSTQVQESVQRMMQQRRDLLSGLTTAVDEVGEIYAKLLELAAATDLLGMHTDEIREATPVNQSLTTSAECSPTSPHLGLSIRSDRPPDRPDIVEQTQVVAHPRPFESGGSRGRLLPEAASTSDPAVRAGPVGGVVPVGCAEFGGGGGQVVADGTGGQRGLPRDVLDGGAGGGEFQDVGLSAGEGAVAGADGLGSKFRVDVPATGVDGADDIGEYLRGDGFG